MCKVEIFSDKDVVMAKIQTGLTSKGGPLALDASASSPGETAAKYVISIDLMTFSLSNFTAAVDF